MVRRSAGNTLSLRPGSAVVAVGFAYADAVIAAGSERHVEAITPKVRGDRDRFEVLLPGDPGFADA